MRGRFLSFALSLALVPLFLGCTSKFETLLPDAQANYSAIKTYEETRSLYVSAAGADVQIHAKFKAPNKLKAEVTYPITASATCDGNKFSLCVPDYSTCVSLPLDEDSDLIPPRTFLKLLSPHLHFVDLSDRFDSKMVTKEDMDGRKVVVFELTPRQKSPMASAKLWIEADRPVITRVEVYNANGDCKGRTFFSNFQQISGIWLPQDYRLEMGDGTPMITLSVTDVKVNEDIPDTVFVFSPSSDMVVLDEVPPLGGVLPDILFFE